MLTLAQSGGMGWLGSFLMVVLLGLGCFMILLVLLQRGRGGGLVGALGGAGGQSAFGTRAGDVFTKITIVVATLWVLNAGIAGIALRGAATAGSSGLAEEEPSAGLGGGLGAPAGLETADPIDTEALTGSSADTPEGDSTEGGTTAPAAPALPAPDATGTAPKTDDAAPGEAASTEKPAEDAKPAEPATEEASSEEASTEPASEEKPAEPAAE